MQKLLVGVEKNTVSEISDHKHDCQKLNKCNKTVTFAHVGVFLRLNYPAQSKKLDFETKLFQINLYLVIRILFSTKGLQLQ